MRAAQSHNSISSAPISRAAARTSPVAMRPEPASSLGNSIRNGANLFGLPKQVLRSVRLLAVIPLAGNCRMGDDQNSL